MDSKEILQHDAEQLLSNPAFDEAIKRYLDKYENQLQACNASEDAMRIVLAKQAAYEFIRVIKTIIDDGMIHTYNKEQEAKRKPKEQEKFVRYPS